MTSTTTFGGFNPESRNSSKVLKPPGGGSSDIFGTGSQQDGSTPRRVKNHQQSNLFLSDDPAPTNTPSRNHGKDTYSRLFGPAQETPSSCSKNRMKSNILLSDEDTANRNTQPKSPSTDSIDGQTNGENGHVEEGGQENLRNGNAGPMNGNGNPAPQAPAQPRARVPPGGFSSGLW